MRPFEPGFGDSRKLPEKMLGETTRQATMRGMGYAQYQAHSGMGDGTKVFKTEENPALLCVGWQPNHSCRAACRRITAAALLAAAL